MRKRRAIFVDRDGTILREPADEQIDSLDKVSFYPGAISGLAALRGLEGFDIVLATNQDGLGTSSFPLDDFEPPQKLMLDTLKGEGILFDDMLIDRTFPDENSPTRKPGTGMFGKYLDGSYDMSGSYVIGDRATDILLANNLGAKGILLADKSSAADLMKKAGTSGREDGNCQPVLITDSWTEIADFIRRGERCATVHRKTKETDITVTVDLDGRGLSCIDSGLRFFDHMLDQLNGHSGMSLAIMAKGDLDVDEHHTIEDVAITLGQAIDKALGAKIGIGRYGFALPMDESRATVLLDFGGRTETVWDVELCRERVGDVPTEMFPHFFKSFAQHARCNMYIHARGENTHHVVECVFKAFARALRMAVSKIPFDYSLPTTKGCL